MSKKHERNCERKKIYEKQKERNIKEGTKDNKKQKKEKRRKREKHEKRKIVKEQKDYLNTEWKVKT